jgi:CSLREA domain-containing protein
MRKHGVTIAIAILLLGVFLSASAWAAVYTVNNPFDVSDANPGSGVCETASGNGVCTLRAAIQEANALAGDDSIILPPNTYLLTQTAEVAISENLTITGSGAATTIINGNKSLRPGSGVLKIFNDAVVGISGVTIYNGSEGGIFNSGTLTLTNITVSGNSASTGGGINNGEVLTVINSTVSGNSANISGGGILNFPRSTVGLFNSTITDNRSDADSDGIGTGGGVADLFGNLKAKG